MIAPSVELAVSRLIHRESYLLDQRKWREWLALFSADVVYWAPSWANELEQTTDPANELSLIYFRGRTGLEDRIFRIETGDSMASVPGDRTVHLIGSVIVHSHENARIEATAAWLTHSYGPRGAMLLGGHYEYSLRQEKDELLISRKKIVLLNDGIEGPVDITHL